MKTRMQILLTIFTCFLIANFVTAGAVLGEKYDPDMDGPDLDINIPPVLKAPFLLVAERTASSISLKWGNSNTGEDGYELQKENPPYAGWNPWTTLEVGGPLDGGPYVFEDFGPLKGDTQYCYRLRVFNDNEEKFSKRCVRTDRVEPKGIHRASVKVLTYNVFGFNEKHCAERARGLGKAIAQAEPSYDIVGLQEYYKKFSIGFWPLKYTITCHPKHLKDGLKSNQDYKGGDNYFLFQPDDAFLIDGDPFFDGGLGIFTPYHILNQESEAFQVKGKGSATWGTLQGILFAQIEIPDTSIIVDTYVVHTYSLTSDKCDRACRQAELEQLAAKIHDISSESGNPVLIMGDFNIKGPPDNTQHQDYCYSGPEDPNNPYTKTEICLEDSRYEDIANALQNPQDLWLENHKGTGEMGYTTVKCFGGKCGTEKRIDYIFIPTSDYLTNNPYKIFIRNREDVRVVRFNAQYGGPASDHYGIEATIEIWEPPQKGTYDYADPGLAKKWEKINKGFTHLTLPDNKVSKSVLRGSNSSKITKPIGGQGRIMKGVQPKEKR